MAGGSFFCSLDGLERPSVPLRRRCQVCGAETRPGLDLGHQPVGDLILDAAQLREPETYYPMQHFHCDECGLTQLGFVVDPEIVYKITKALFLPSNRILLSGFCWHKARMPSANAGTRKLVERNALVIVAAPASNVSNASR